MASVETWLASLSDKTSVFSPEASGDLYLSEAMSMNLLKSDFPAVVVVPGTETDLIRSLVFATKNRIRVVARCSGHDFNGRSNGRGVMLIKTGRLNMTTYNPKDQTITFGSGCNHECVYGALVPYKRMYVGGQSKTVCPAGCLAGGCHGLLSRQFGLGADSILEIRFALFNGTVLTLTRRDHSRLFHAYLGAGQNSFGIALSFKAKTYPSPDLLYEANAVLSLVDPTPGSGSDVLSTLFMNVTWWSATPRGLSGNIFIFPDYVVIKWFYTGTEPEEALATLGPILESPFLLSVDPIKNHTSMAELSESIYPDDKDIWTRSFITNVLVPPDQAILDGFIGAILTNRPNLYMWFVFGGAVASGTTGSMASGMRTAMYEVLFGEQWSDPNKDLQHVTAFLPALPMLYGPCPSSYNNEVTTWAGSYNALPDWKTRFYRNYTALLDVKRRYDPCNTFTAMYGVGSDLPAATCVPKSCP